MGTNRVHPWCYPSSGCKDIPNYHHGNDEARVKRGAFPDFHHCAVLTGGSVLCGVCMEVQHCRPHAMLSSHKRPSRPQISPHWGSSGHFSSPDGPRSRPAPAMRFTPQPGENGASLRFESRIFPLSPLFVFFPLSLLEIISFDVNVVFFQRKILFPPPLPRTSFIFGRLKKDPTARKKKKRQSKKSK